MYQIRLNLLNNKCWVEYVFNGLMLENVMSIILYSDNRGFILPRK